jgi:PAS domain S-box-containing protein
MQPSLSEARTDRAELTTLEDERFHELMDHAPFLLWISGPDGLCTFFNRPWLDFRGRTIDEEMGNGWVEGVHPDDVRSCLDTYQRALENRQQFHMEYRLRRADGEYRWIVDAGVPQFAKDGSFLGFIGSGVEIQETRPVRSPTPLTSRELEVLTLVAEGKSTKEVAAMLNISYKTADSHRSRIMEKLGIHETASLVRYAIRHGVVSA